MSCLSLFILLYITFYCQILLSVVYTVVCSGALDGSIILWDTITLEAIRRINCVQHPLTSFRLISKVSEPAGNNIICMIILTKHHKLVKAVGIICIFWIKIPVMSCICNLKFVSIRFTRQLYVPSSCS